jgi:tyrosine-protein phosphatase SIW14
MLVVRWLAVTAIVVSIFGGPYAYSIQRQKHIRNFRVVDDGILYRSAQLSPDGMGRMIHDYGFRSVVSLRFSKGGRPPADQWEEEFCAKLGVKHYRIRLADEEKAAAGDQDIFDAGVKQFLEVMRDPKNHPVLVHCYRGVHRTGAQCAVYRMEFNGWSKTEAIEEMRSRGYDVIDDHADLQEFLERFESQKK